MSNVQHTIPTWAQKSGQRGLLVNRVFLEDFIRENTVSELDAAVLDKSQLHAKKLVLSQARRLLELSALDNRVHFQWKVGDSQRLYTGDYNVQGLNSRLREAFVPDPGYQFVTVRYPALQLRVMAMISGDPWLTEAFASEKDVHAFFFGKVMGVSPSKVTQTEREQGKAMVHAFYFGFNPQGMAKRMDLTLTDAVKLHRKLVDLCPKFYAWALEQIDRVRVTGYLEVPEYGFKRAFETIRSADEEERTTAERSVINTLVQLHEANLVQRQARALELLESDNTYEPLLVVHDQILAQTLESNSIEDLSRDMTFTEGAVFFPAEVEFSVNWQ